MDQDESPLLSLHLLKLRTTHMKLQTDAIESSIQTRTINNRDKIECNMRTSEGFVFISALGISQSVYAIQNYKRVNMKSYSKLNFFLELVRENMHSQPL